MAPTKALFVQRLMACDFMGMNWCKVTHHGPFNAFYPFSQSGGPQTRIWSHPLWQGNRVNRMGFNTIRMFALATPTIFIAGLIAFMCDWYAPYALYTAVTGNEPAANIVAARDEEMRLASRHKPGHMLKHELGNQVSIPGSEILAKPVE